MELHQNNENDIKYHMLPAVGYPNSYKIWLCMSLQHIKYPYSNG